MIRYVARKLLLAVPLLFCIVSLVFLLVELSPGDATSRYLHKDMPPEVAEMMTKKHGLDQPATTRYARMITNLAVLDFGRSIHQERPVFDVVAESLPNTLLLSLLTLAVAFPLGILLGTVQAMRQGSAIDTGASIGALTLYSMPAFWVGLMLQLTVGLYWGEWLRDLHQSGVISAATAEFFTLPNVGMKDAVMYEYMSWPEQLMDRISHLILPGIAMGVASAASIARYMRSSMLDIIRQDFVRTARAKGLTEWQVVLRHGVRNALLPIVTLLGLSLPFLFSGSILVELVFGWPGMGRVIYGAITTEDTPLLIACFYVYTLVVVSGNLLADIAYAWVDPRIRLS